MKTYQIIQLLKMPCSLSELSVNGTFAWKLAKMTHIVSEQQHYWNKIRKNIQTKIIVISQVLQNHNERNKCIANTWNVWQSTLKYVFFYLNDGTIGNYLLTT